MSDETTQKGIAKLAEEFHEEFPSVELSDHKYIVESFLEEEHFDIEELREWYNSKCDENFPNLIKQMYEKGDDFFYTESNGESSKEDDGDGVIEGLFMLSLLD